MAGGDPRGLRLGWFDVLGSSRTGAIAARSITYWLRDPRYQASLVAVPDFASLYLALAHGLDPMAVPAIDEMKELSNPIPGVIQ